MKKYRLIICFFLIILLFGCAKQSHPTGGDKDETPPTLIQSNPIDRTTNFNKNEIELIFDEAIQVNNPREQIIITPSIGKDFEANYRKNKVILKLNADLLENTTYTIAFRESIQDLTERNPAQNLTLAFSTGDYIDSLSIQGVVYDLLQDKPVKNYIVAAIPYSDTLNFFEHEAQWITLTNAEGEYALENLKPGKYTVYAFEDKNKNLRVDSKSERFGFFSKPINLDSNIRHLNIAVVKLDSRPLQLISAKPIASTFNVRANKGLSSYTLTPLDTTLTLASIPEDDATIRIYNTFHIQDSIPFNLIAIDSINNAIDTLLYLKFETRSRLEKFQAKIEEVVYFQNTATLKSNLSFNKPVTHLYPDSIYIQLDSVTFIRFKPEEFKWNPFHSHLIIESKLPKDIDFGSNPSSPTQTRDRRDQSLKSDNTEPLKRESLYNQLIIAEATFISAELDSSTFMKAAINKITPENSGVIIIEAQIPEKIIIQLLGQGNKVIAQSTNHKTRFENLKPGDYQIRVIVDKNGNQKWDPGNYFTKTEPEPIIFYQNEKKSKNITLKANWEVGPLLITTEQPVDKQP